MTSVTITCADCGEMQCIPALPPGATAKCHRCDRLLAQSSRTGYELTLACAVAIFILLPPAIFMPLMSSSIRNFVFQESRLVSSVSVIYREVWFPFAFGFLFLAFAFPALRALLQIVVLASLRMGWRVWQRGRLFRWSEELRTWSMTDVVLIAGSIAYFRASIPADVVIGAGAWCYIAVALLFLIGDYVLDRRAVWNAILPDRTSIPDHQVSACDVCEMIVTSRRSGDHCPRCGSRLERAIAPRYIPAIAAVAASIPLFLPAFGASIMVNQQFTGVLEHTIVGTVQLMTDKGFWYAGVVVLIAGIAVPVLEVIGLIWLLARVRFPNRKGLVVRTHAFRILRRLVRWPMILPFIAAIAAPIVSFRGLDDIVAGPGSTPMFMLIALLMFAMRMFEPKHMWRTAGEVA